MTINIELFLQLISAYGSNPAHWPQEKREAMQDFIAAEPKARAALSHEAELDKYLAARLDDAPADLEARIIDNMTNNIAPITPPTTINRAPFLGIASTITALAAVLVAGIISAPILIDILTPPDVLAVVDDLTSDILFN